MSSQGSTAEEHHAKTMDVSSATVPGRKARLPVDRGWAWAVAVGAAINTFWSLGSFSVYGVIFVEVIEMYDTSSAMSAVMFSVFMATCCVAVLVQAAITGKATERTISIVAGISFSLSLCLQFVSPNVYYFVTIFGILGGIGSTFAMYTGIVVLGTYFHKKLSIASGLAFVGASCGQFIIPQILNKLLDSYGLRGALLILGACHLHPIVSGMLFRPVSFYERQPKSRSGSIASHHSENLKIAAALTVSGEKCPESGALLYPALPNDNDNEDSTNMPKHSDLPPSLEKQESADVQQDTVSQSTSTSDIPESPTRNKDADLEKGPDFDDVTAPRPGTKRSCSDVKVEVRSLPDDVGILSARQAFKALITWPRFYLFAAGRCLCVIANYLLILFIPPLAISLDFSMSEVATLLTIMGIIDLPSRPFHGWVVSLKRVDVSYYIGCTSLLCSAIVFVCTFLPSRASVYIMGILMTVLYNPNLCLMNVITIASVGKELFARALMLFMMVTYAMLTFLPIVFGRLYDTLGSYTIPMAICAISGVTGGALTVLERKIRQKT